MNRLVWKLLRQHISIAQLAGFFFANLIGMLIVLLSIQCYLDIRPIFTEGDSFIKKNYMVATKKVNALSSLTGKSNHFTPNEIKALKEQDFTEKMACFTPAMFKVSAGIGLQNKGLHLSTKMFFESVPDNFIDISLEKWHYQPDTDFIPIVIPRSYLNLYNFGFAQSQGLPKLSEGLTSLIQLNITIDGNGWRDQFKGNIVGFSNRLNTILVPQDFMDWANEKYAPGKEVKPSRLILEVKNPTDPAIANYFKKHKYETEGDSLDAGKTTYFLQLVIGIVLTVGLIISLLSFYILILSIFLLLQKNSKKLENLLLLGYKPGEIAMPYYILTIGLNLGVLLLAWMGVWMIRGYYLNIIHDLTPNLETGSVSGCVLTGIILFAAVSFFNITAIRKKIASLPIH